MANVKVCRICVKETSILYNLFQLTALDADGNEVSLHEMLSYCCSAKLQTNLSLWICSSCSEACMNAYNFIKLFHKNDEAFKKLQERIIQNAKEIEIKIELLNYSENIDDEVEDEHGNEEIDDDIGMEPLQLPLEENPTIDSTDQQIDDENLAGEKEKDKPMYECSICMTNFTAGSSLTRHMNKQHKKKKKAVYPDERIATSCKDIDKPRTLRSQEAKLKDEKLYRSWMVKCPSCTETFQQKDILTDHLAEKHKNEIIICDECDELFSNALDYDAHYEERHYKSCSICKINFKSRKSFMKHWRQHKIRSCYVTLRNQCPLCSKDVPLEHLVRHINANHGGQVNCHLCPNQADDVPSFLDHYLKVHRIKCDQCKRYCISQKQYDMHFNPNYVFKNGTIRTKGLKRKRT